MPALCHIPMLWCQKYCCSLNFMNVFRSLSFLSSLGCLPKFTETSNFTCLRIWVMGSLWIHQFTRRDVSACAERSPHLHWTTSGSPARGGWKKKILIVIRFIANSIHWFTGHITCQAIFFTAKKRPFFPHWRRLVLRWEKGNLQRQLQAVTWSVDA